MEIKTHIFHDNKIADVNSEEIIIQTIEDGVDLMGNLYFQGFDSIILYKNQITPDFFDLKTGIAGEILQKFSTYRVRLFIVGDFSEFKSKSLQEFIFESNKGRHVNFVNTIHEVMETFLEGLK